MKHFNASGFSKGNRVLSVVIARNGYKFIQNAPLWIGTIIKQTSVSLHNIVMKKYNLFIYTRVPEKLKIDKRCGTAAHRRVDRTSPYTFLTFRWDSNRACPYHSNSDSSECRCSNVLSSKVAKQGQCVNNLEVLFLNNRWRFYLKNVHSTKN